MNRECAQARLLALLAAALFSSALWLSQTALALDPQKAITQYSHDVWQIEDGLPQNSISAIVQTRDGYLWLGTLEGLVRFDGVEFTVFDMENTPALKNNRIVALCEDRQGSLWIGAEGGGLSRYRDGTFSTYTRQHGLPSDSVGAIDEDREGNLWLVANGRLVRFKDGRFTIYTADDGLPGQTVRTVFVDRQGRVWVGTIEGGLCQFNAGRFTVYTTKDGLSSNAVWSICDDQAGNLWVGTANGLNRWANGRFTVYTTRQGLSNNFIWSLYGDRHGNLWAGTQGGGLNRLSDGRITSFTTREGLSNDVIWSIYEDREGSLWIGTNGGGLNRLKDGKFMTYTTRDGLSNDFVWSVYEDREGSFWMGTYNGGLSRLKDGRFTTYTTNDGLSSNFIWSVYGDRQGNLWVGTTNGLNRLRDGRFTVYTTKDGLPDNGVRCSYEDRNGVLWIGTGGGLARLQDGRFTVYTIRDGLADNTVMAITEDPAGNLWVGTMGGLTRLKDGRLTTYRTEDGLSNNIVRSVYADPDGTLWIGTLGGGLNRFRDGRFTRFTMKQGLFDNVISQILEDDRGHLWMSCNKGIFRVSKKELDDMARGAITSITPVAYDAADGMKSRECNGSSQPAGWKTRDGKLLFPTIKGVVVVDPDSIPINHIPPPVVIKKVVVDDQAIDLRAQAEWPPGQGKFEFHYAGLSFLAPEKVRFKYLLEGFDKAWVNAGTRRVAYYTNLPPGQYRFRVRACNNDGVWNETGAGFAFYLRPRFYQTDWFYGLCGVAVIVGAWGLDLLRVKRLVERTQRLEAKVAERTAEVVQQKNQLAEANERLEQANEELTALNQEKSDFLAIAAHDLRAPLVNLKGYAGELRASLQALQAEINAVWPHLDEKQRRVVTELFQQDMPEALGFIDSSARRMDSLVGAIIRLYRLGRRELHPATVKMDEVVRETLRTLAYQIEQRQVKVTVGPLPDVVADRSSMELILENILTNAVTYLDPNRPGEIEITGARDHHEVTFHVRDNGRGIAPEEMDRVFKIFSRAGRPDVPGEGMGLAYVHALIRRHGGRIWCQSQVGEGTTFSFTLPDPGREIPNSKIQIPNKFQ